MEKKDLLANYLYENREKHYRMAYSYAKDENDAMDIVQESIYKAFKHLNSLKKIDSLPSWFCTLLVNTAKDHIKRNSKVIALDSQVLEVQLEKEKENQERDPQDILEEKVTNLELKKELDKLSFNEKTVIVLRYFEDMDLKEVAAATDLNLSTVKSTLYRALEKLRIKLSSQEEI